MAEFDESGCRFRNSNDKVIATAARCGSLYLMNCRSCEQVNAVCSKEDVWHRRYGHLSFGSLKQLAVDGMVDGFDFDASGKTSFCESCVEGKHHRSPFPTGGCMRVKEPLELVHTDVCGKMNSTSLGGAQYFMTFIDDKTRYVWVYFLRRKSEVFSRFLEWKVIVERQFGRKLKVLRSDNGGEYVSRRFIEYLKSEGVTNELTVPKTPQQNGVAERQNRTLVEMMRAMLAESDLPQYIWAEALSTAVYLRNRSPTRAVKDKTPFEALFGRKPNVEHIGVFGCVGYSLVPKDERRKLDVVAKRCVLVGYGSEVKGYRLFDPERQKVRYSRDVRFNETEFGLKKESSPVEPIRLVDVGSSDDTDDVEHDSDGGGSVDESPTVMELRRSQRERCRPQYFSEGVSIAAGAVDEPSTFEEAVSSANKAKWEKAVEAEMRSLDNNHVWDLVQLPEGRKLVGSKWVFKVKLDGDGQVERYKARLVAQGFTQTKGADYDETFSPVVRMESLRTVVGLAVRNGLQIRQLDVTTAFLNGTLNELVYMRQPEGFVAEGKEHLVCKLNRSLYGLKKSHGVGIRRWTVF